MSLNFNYKAMTDRGINIFTTKPDVADEDQEINGITNALIWSTLVVGCDGRKIDTFIQRIREYEMATGPLMHWPRPEWTERAIAANVIRADSRHEDGYISKAELKRHEGLSTNATTLTDAQWAKNLARIINGKAQSSLNRELSK